MHLAHILANLIQASSMLCVFSIKCDRPQPNSNQMQALAAICRSQTTKLLTHCQSDCGKACIIPAASRLAGCRINVSGSIIKQHRH